MSKVRFGSVSWRPDKGKWRARYRHLGERVERLFTSEADALAWLEGEAAKVLTATWTSPTHTGLRFAEVLEAWWETRDVERGTAARDASVITNHVLPALGDLPVGEVDYGVLTRFVRNMARDGYSAAHTRRAYQIARKGLSFAHQEKLIGAVPPAVDNLPKQRRQTLDVLTMGEVWAVADTIDRRYRALVVCGGYTGARLGELLGLRVHNLDLVHRVMSIVEDLENVQGQIRVGAPLKNNQSRRYVNLPQLVVAELDAHLEEYGVGTHGLVFTGPRGAPIRLDNWRRRHWTPAVTQAAGRYLPPYRLRHTSATEALALGASVSEVAAQHGNSPKVVWQTYVQHREQGRRLADLYDAADPRQIPNLAPAGPQNASVTELDGVRPKSEPVET